MQREAAGIRQEWLEQALSTLPADRPAAEAAISGLYRSIGLAPPRFHWVGSPVAALMTVPPGMGPRPREPVERISEWPLPPRFVSMMRRLCGELDARLGWKHRPLEQVIRQRVRSALSRSERGTSSMALRAAGDPHGPHGPGAPLGTFWYEAQTVSWIAHYDAMRRAVGVSFASEQARRFDLWAVAARSCGRWWPRENVCVVTDRPVVVRTEVWGDDGELRLHCADGPAMRFADGWEVYAWHGTLVPSWVVTDPTADRIERETNVEVRRCAIENIGWESYIDGTGLWPVGSAPDPGNPGAQLHLYELRENTRVLLAVNGSVERDGQRRRYGLTVPGFIQDPIAAAGWTYGLSADEYALLVRRT